MSPADSHRGKELEPSQLDDKTHAEMRLIFEDSFRAILFAKGLHPNYSRSGIKMVVSID